MIDIVVGQGEWKWVAESFRSFCLAPSVAYNEIVLFNGRWRCTHHRPISCLRFSAIQKNNATKKTSFLEKNDTS